MSFFQRDRPRAERVVAPRVAVAPAAPPRPTRDALDVPEVAAGIRHLLQLAGSLVVLHDGTTEFRAAADRIRLDLDRASLSEDLRAIAKALRALELPPGIVDDPQVAVVARLLGPVVDALVPLAEAIGPEAPLASLRRIREQLEDPRLTADAAEQLARVVEHLAGAVEWLKRLCEILKVSVGEMLGLMGRLAADEPPVVHRLEAIRLRIEQAAELHELEALRDVLLRETRTLVDGARERSAAFTDAHGRLAETRRQVEVLETALGDAEARARTDALTGLPNRTALAEAVKALAESTSTTGVLAIDVDHFKRVNDRYGHGAGDAVLRRIAAVIQGELRGDDRAFRVGGEELLVLLHDVTVEGAVATAQRLRRRVAREAVAIGDLQVAVTVSIGVSTWTAGKPFDAVSAAADAALYEAKGAGRDRVCARAC